MRPVQWKHQVSKPYIEREFVFSFNVTRHQYLCDYADRLTLTGLKLQSPPHSSRDSLNDLPIDYTTEKERPSKTMNYMGQRKITEAACQ